ncbi:MAG: PLP-dependent aminotransferase family protein, partial [Burkholderiales bacterium]|nr:PLP-dependent aminotransferase family protein [Burkholderiales bacterium]
MNAPAAASEPFLYRDLAERLAHSVATGAFRIGDRLPSVRELAAQERVSIATAVAAYRDLEARRIIEARPKSGFFVAPRRNQLPEPASSARRQRRCSLDGVSRLTLEILEAAGNPDVVPLGAACPSPELMFSATEVRRVTAARLRSDPGLATEYRMGPGFAPLRRAIAQQAFAFGCTLDPDEIVVTNGCMEALTLGLRAITKPGDTVAMESPTYFGLLQIAESLGLKVLEIPTSPRHGMSVEALDLATRRPGAIAAVVVTPTISNPLGSVMPDAAKRRLVALMAERDIPVIEDDVYGDLHFGERRPRVLRSWDATGNVLLCSSFTKTVAPGLRVGWIAPGRWR